MDLTSVPLVKHIRSPYPIKIREQCWGTSPFLIRGRPIWFAGEDRSEASMALFYDWLGEKKTRGIRLAVMADLGRA